ncbi:MAG: ATP-binding SpoIIE family protein phosphatase, partial [Vulcanimicrobiaceae bacterium]
VNIDPTAFHPKETIAVAEDLTRRAAMAIDNSRLYQREHRVATALQEAMLPASLPHHSQLEFSYAYRPAERESQVGGDWYDAFSVAPNQIAVSIGDVGGHGLGAAVAMSEARQALRLGALEGLAPADLLHRVNLTLSLNERQPIITAIFGIVDLERATFTYSCAGHPPPALATLDREARYLAGGGIPIGVLRDAAFPTHEVRLEPHSTLLLYTDGLIEFSRDIATESDRLLDGLRNRVQDLLPDGAEALLRYMLHKRQVDDIAVLVATWLPQTQEPIALTLPAVPESARIARRIADRFARAAKLSEERGLDLALAIGEGVANAAEHAYGGSEGAISIRIAAQNGSVAGVITDSGRWREGSPKLDRGRGLEIVRAVAKRAEIEHLATGTRLSFEV